MNLDFCHLCENTVYATTSQLDRHIKNKHTSTRSSTNLELATSLLFNKTTSSEINQWESGLKWLVDVFQPSPPFRQSLLLNLKHKSLDAVVDAFRDLISTTVQASIPPSNDRDASNRQFQSDPFWTLTAIFEQLVLAPRPPKEELPPNAESIAQCIYRRVRWFRAGRFQDLYAESRQVKSKSPSAQRSSSSSNSNYIKKTAQLAADVDNYGTCNYRLTKNTPVAIADDYNISSLQKLHPNELYPPSVPCLRSSPRRKNTKQRHKNCKQFIITPEVIVNNILHLKKGKATGLQVDSIDLFIILAQRSRHNNSKKKSLKPFSFTLAEFFTLVANGKIPKSLISIYRTTYLVALEKDPDDNTKLRPLGIPSAVRRITANTIANETKAQFAAHLLPYNYAAGVKGGIDFITSTVRLGVEKYISNQTDQEL